MLLFLGNWMEGQGPPPAQPGFGFPPRGFPSPEIVPERFGSPMFDDSGRGRGGQIRGRGRGGLFPARPEEHKREDDDFGVLNPKRLSRWSNPSPPPAFTPQNNDENLIKSVENAEALVSKENPKDNGNETISEPQATSLEPTSNTLPSDEPTPSKDMEICDSQQMNSPKPADVSCKEDVSNNCTEVQESVKSYQEELGSFSPNPNSGLLHDVEMTTGQSQSNANESLNQSFDFDFDMTNITERTNTGEKAGFHSGSFAGSSTDCFSVNEKEVDQLQSQEEPSSTQQQCLDSFDENFKPSVVEEPQRPSESMTDFDQESEHYEREQTMHSFLVEQKSSIILAEDHLSDQASLVSSQVNNESMFDDSAPSSLFNDLETNFNSSIQHQNAASVGEVHEGNMEFGASQISSMEHVSTHSYNENPGEDFDIAPLETEDRVMTSPPNSADLRNCEVNEPTVVREQIDSFEQVEENVETTNPIV